MSLKILGTGSSAPKEILHNSKIAEIVDTTDEFITSRTGIRERRIAVKETTISMAVDASKIALTEANVKPEEIDLILLTTMTPDNSCPNTACSVQDQLGAVNAVAIDINTNCSGFVFAMSIANAYVNLNKYKTILIISAELLSKIIDYTDRTTCILFGDGAGAAVFRPSDGGMTYISEHADGSGGKYLSAGSVPRNNLFNESIEKFRYPLMDGKEIVNFATTRVPDNINEVLEQAKVDISEVKYFILHQANIKIIEGIAEVLDIDMSKFPTNIDKYGNTSSASIPILLDEVNKANMLKAGDKIILAGYGGGLTWATALIEW